MSLAVLPLDAFSAWEQENGPIRAQYDVESAYNNKRLSQTINAVATGQANATPRSLKAGQLDDGCTPQAAITRSPPHAATPTPFQRQPQQQRCIHAQQPHHHERCHPLRNVDCAAHGGQLRPGSAPGAVRPLLE